MFDFFSFCDSQATHECRKRISAHSVHTAKENIFGYSRLAGQSERESKYIRDFMTGGGCSPLPPPLK